MAYINEAAVKIITKSGLILATLLAKKIYSGKNCTTLFICFKIVQCTDIPVSYTHLDVYKRQA